METHPKKTRTIPADAEALQNAVKGFADAGLLARMAKGEIQTTSNAGASMTRNAQNRIEVTAHTEGGLLATESISPDGKPLSQITLSAPALESLKPDLRLAIVRQVERESAILPKPLDARQKLELEETSAGNLIAAGKDQAKTGPDATTQDKKAPLTPGESHDITTAITGFTNRKEFEHITALVNAGNGGTATNGNVALSMNKEKHQLEVTLRTEDGLRSEQTFSADGKPTSDLTLAAPSLARLSPGAREAVVKAVEQEAKAMHLDARHELRLEETTAQNLLAVGQDQQATAPAQGRGKKPSLPPR